MKNLGFRVMTALIAVPIILGLLYLLVALWILRTGRAPRTTLRP